MFISFTPIEGFFHGEGAVHYSPTGQNHAPRARALGLAWAVFAACALSSFANLAWAQASAPANAASASPSTDRSQDPAYSVFRWIKIQGDAPRKSDVVKAKPKAEAAAPVARKPEPQTAGSGITERVETIPATPTAKASAPAELAPLTAASASAPAPAVTVAVAPPAAARAPEPVEDEEADLKLISQVPPTFPRELRREISKGKVMVKFTVQPDGTVRDASVVSFSNRGLNRPALEAISQWKFAPIQTARTVQVEIEYEL